MATAPDDVIRYLRTSGGSEGVKASYADQTFIGFAIGSDVSDREAAFAKFAFLAWAELIDIPTFPLGGTYPHITFRYSTDVSDSATGVMRTSLLFSLDHKREVIINRNKFDEADVALGNQASLHTCTRSVMRSASLIRGPTTARRSFAARTTSIRRTPSNTP